MAFGKLPELTGKVNITICPGNCVDKVGFVVFYSSTNRKSGLLLGGLDILFLKGNRCNLDNLRQLL